LVEISTLAVSVPSPSATSPIRPLARTYSSPKHSFRTASDADRPTMCGSIWLQRSVTFSEAQIASSAPMPMSLLRRRMQLCGQLWRCLQCLPSKQGCRPHPRTHMDPCATRLSLARTFDHKCGGPRPIDVTYDFMAIGDDFRVDRPRNVLPGCGEVKTIFSSLLLWDCSLLNYCRRFYCKVRQSR
jgi:hypothetical protein